MSLSPDEKYKMFEIAREVEEISGALNKKLEEFSKILVKETTYAPVEKGWHSLSIDERVSIMRNKGYLRIYNNVSEKLIFWYALCTHPDYNGKINISTSDIKKIIRMHDLECARDEVQMNEAIS